MLLQGRDEAQTPESGDLKESIVALARNLQSSVKFRGRLRGVALQKTERASPQGEIAQQFGVILGGESLGLGESRFGGRKMKEEAFRAALRDLPAHREVARSERRRQFGAQDIERLPRQPSLQKDFGVENSEAPVPFRIRIGEIAQLALNGRLRRVQVAALKL